MVSMTRMLLSSVDTGRERADVLVSSKLEAHTVASSKQPYLEIEGDEEFESVAGRFGSRGRNR